MSQQFTSINPHLLLMNLQESWIKDEQTVKQQKNDSNESDDKINDIQDLEYEQSLLQNSQMLAIDETVAIGRIISGNKNKYKIVSALGQGTSGIVYQCEVLESVGNIVALKVGNKRAGNWEQQKGLYEAYIREKEIQSKINSEHIVQIIEHFEQKSHVFIVLEYCNQKDLKHVMQMDDNALTNKKIPVYLATEYIAQIIQGYLEFQSNFKNKLAAHRDLKPANIMLHNNVVKITDFGCAKVIDSKEMLISYVGSKLWMAPEIMQAHEYTNKCDVFSIGVIYYQLIYGRAPFPGKTICKLLEIIEQQDFLFDENEEIKPINQLLQQMLKFNEKERISFSNLVKSDIFSQRKYLKDVTIAMINQDEKLKLLPEKTKNNLILQLISIGSVKKWICEKNYRKTLKEIQNFCFQYKMESQLEIQKFVYEISNCSLSLVDLKQFSKYYVGENVSEIYKNAKKMKPRTKLSLQNEINRVFYNNETNYLFDQKEQKQICRNYVQMYYEVMEQEFKEQFENFERKHMKYCIDNLMDYQEALEMIIQKDLFRLKMSEQKKQGQENQEIQSLKKNSQQVNPYLQSQDYVTKDLYSNSNRQSRQEESEGEKSLAKRQYDSGFEMIDYDSTQSKVNQDFSLIQSKMAELKINNKSQNRNSSSMNDDSETRHYSGELIEIIEDDWEQEEMETVDYKMQLKNYQKQSLQEID